MNCPNQHSSDPSSSCPVNHSSSITQCPVDHTKIAPTTHPYFTNTTTTTTTTSDYHISHNSDDLNQYNHLPSDLSYQPRHPDQTIDLSLDREVSTIPKGNNDSNNNDVWIYPSQQMFFNAMKRKNWDPKEQDMAVVVPIHNAVNEMAWKKILEWESHTKNSSCSPKLERFQGRPGHLTPRAWFKSTFLGYTRPFDRHDWTIDRCGKPIHYVIDFYSGQLPKNSKPTAGMISFYLDVRPKLDTWDGIKLRIVKFWSDWIL